MNLLTVKQVAEQAGVSEALVYSWVEDRLLAVYRLGGRGKRGKIMVEEADLVAFLRGCRVESEPVKVSIVNVRKGRMKDDGFRFLPPK